MVQTNILNVIINATTISALYALIAIGFTLIFGVGGVLNFAHGALITVGAIGTYLVSNSLGLPVIVGMVVGTLAAAAVGAVMYLGAIQFIEDQPVTLSILTFVIGFAIAHFFRIFVSSGDLTVDLLIGGGTTFLGQGIRYIDVFIFVLSWTIIIGVFYFVNRTKTGQAILATSMTKKGAALVGVESKKVNLYVWVMAAAFAGLAGTLLVMKQAGSWNMGTSPLILAFSIVILGGLGSIRGSVVGAYVIGFVETFTTQVISTKLTGLASLVLLIAFLLVKPEGLFGREAAE
ncbi:branched-chain amino acid ABC transporter permease [Halorarius halobius]|uniref:branched-chain amino acid ABC transporter permease n=1 Tax=Halorarius halobius TaxID=2962671 RepID=UPI0020CE5663|nr:branched-chain amino acid ABC transporter permease [Halorarius halobius]